MGCDFRTWGQSRIVDLGDGPSWDKRLISVFFFHLFVESSSPMVLGLKSP